MADVRNDPRQWSCQLCRQPLSYFERRRSTWSPGSVVVTQESLRNCVGDQWHCWCAAPVCFGFLPSCKKFHCVHNQHTSSVLIQLKGCSKGNVSLTWDFCVLNFFKSTVSLPMDVLLRTLGPGVHCYLPFRTYTDKIPRVVLELRELCKHSILRHITLCELLFKVRQLRLPNYLRRYLTTLTTTDFEEIECAPFIDAFSLNFFHRALTYRVFSLVDKQEYMVTHGYCPVEETEIWVFHQKWVELQHDNVMCVCATVHDPATDNVFYLFNQPLMSMVQVCSVLSERRQFLPEILLWKLLVDLSSALLYILSQGLCYGAFGLENVFLLKDRVVLENGLTRKAWRSRTVSREFTKPIFCESDKAEKKAMECLTIMLRNLISENNCDTLYSKSLRDFLTGDYSGKPLEYISELAELSAKNIKNSFSFLELLQGLQHSEYVMNNVM